MIILPFTDTENPKVSTCPTSFEVRLSPGERNRLIFWQEPTFTDNVGVERVYKTRVSKRHRIRPNNPNPSSALENFSSSSLFDLEKMTTLPLLLFLPLFLPISRSFRTILQGIRIFTPFLFPSPAFSLRFIKTFSLNDQTHQSCGYLSVADVSNFLLSLTLCTWRYFSRSRN